jgi:hypothetical protein
MSGHGRLVLLALFLGAGCTAARWTLGGPSLEPFPPAVPARGPGIPPDAVLAFGTDATDDRAAVVLADGRVLYFDAGTGARRDWVDTGARPWTLSFKVPRGAWRGDGAIPEVKYAIPDPLTLAGIPVCVRGGRTVALRGDAVVEWLPSGYERTLARGSGLREVRLLIHAGPGSTVFLAFADGRIGSIAAGSPVRIGEERLPCVPTAVATAGERGPFIVAGTEPAWFLVDGSSLRVLRRVPLHGGPPPVSGLSLDASGSRLVLVSAFQTAVESWVLDAETGLPTGRKPTIRWFKGPSALAVAADPSEDEGAVVAKCLGGWGRIRPGDYHGWPGAKVPSRTVAFAAGGTVALQGWDDGEIVALTWPEEGRLWTFTRR